MDCPSEDTLLAVAEGSLPEHARVVVSEHLDRCDDCRAVVVELVRETSAPVPQAAEAAALLDGRTWAGRYDVTGLLGQGGMGVVYAAWDRTLERRVALKVIRRDGRPHDEARAVRLVRESRAMARLRHPNVVTVFDVGAFRGQAYLAMELVEGGTLRRWLGQGPHAWPQVLAMFRAAGEGLLAAHDVGLVHRDFKPDNVLVDGQGRPRVADFGLARAHEADAPSDDDEADEPAPADASSEASPESAGAPLTRPGAAVGTPGYMAPEQSRGAPIDDRADVFAFCVALHEALLQRRPCADEPLASRDPSARGIPRRVLLALHAGLRADPRARPSLRELLGRLAVAPRRARWAWPLGLALATGGAAALAVVPAETGSVPSIDACEGARAEAAAAWAPERRERLAVAWGQGDDRRDFAALSSALGAYFGRLDEAYAAACSEGIAVGEPGVAVRAEADARLRMSCLELRRLAVGSVLELVAEGDPRAAAAVDVLPSLQECSEPHSLALRMPVPEDPATRVEVERIRRAGTPLRALRDAGRYAEASAGLMPLADEAERLGFAPLLAELAYELGVTRSYEGDGPAGARLVEAAALLAAGAHHDALAAEAWIQLVHIASEELHDYAAAARHLGHARTAVARLGPGVVGDEALARLTYYDAVLAWREGRHDDAMTRYAEAIAMSDGVDPELQSNAMEAKGILHVELGQHAEALALHEEVLGRRRELLGELHPTVGFSYGNLATVHFHAGRHRQALEWGRKAIDLHARMLGRKHPAYGLDLHLQAQILGELGELPEALALARQAREVFEAAHGPDHVEVATMIELEGTLRLENGEPELATERLRESLRIFAEQVGDEAPGAAASRLLLAQALARTGHADEAIAQGQRSLDDYLRTFGPAHIRVVNARSILGEILLDEGHYEPARRQLEQALADLDPAFSVGHRAELRFLLARALLEPRADLPEGRRQLELAARELDEAGETFEYARQLLATWRREHAPLVR